MGGFSTIGGVEREALVSYAGVTDADGAADGTTLKCSAIGSGSGYPDFDGNQVIITSGPYKGQVRDINGATNADAAGTITVANAFDGQITSGTSFIITGIRTVPAEVAALQADIGDFSAQTNLKSLLAVLGSGWDTENKTVYDKLVTDLLEHGTYGLAAQNTYIWDKDISGYSGVKAGTYLKTLYDDWIDGGRLDLLIDAIKAKTDNLKDTWNDLSAAQVNAEVDTALSDVDLDHLINVAAGTGVYPVPLADDSIIAKILSKADPASASSYDNTTDSLEAISDKVALASVCTEARLSELDAANMPADIDAILAATTTDGVVVNSRTNAYKRLAGVPQVIEVSVTSAANAGNITIATITDQPCVIDSIVIHADTAQTTDLTSCAVYGGAGKVVTFISDSDATQANLDAADKQVSWTGAVRLAAGKTIVMSLEGTGSTAVDLTVTITYHAAVDGGYLA